MNWNPPGEVLYHFLCANTMPLALTCMRVLCCVSIGVVRYLFVYICLFIAKSSFFNAAKTSVYVKSMIQSRDWFTILQLSFGEKLPGSYFTKYVSVFARTKLSTHMGRENVWRTAMCMIMVTKMYIIFFRR